MTDDELSRVIAEHVYPGHNWKNQWRDMVNDPAMTVMLMMKLNPGYVINIEDDGKVEIYRYEETEPRGKGKLGRAVAEAYYRAFIER